jgi:carbonic anhydrase/acetyltransferase-like protein (isoleucine patch superfamily)
VIQTELILSQLSESAFIARNATLVGNVSIGSQSSILFNVVIRGDTTHIAIGNQSNVQDFACLHGDPGFPCVIGHRVTIGHHATVHGATVDDDVLIGIGAIVLNGASIGQWSIIGAGALVSEGKVIPPRSLVMGVPGKIVREVTDADIAKIKHAATHYVEIGAAYKAGGEL